MQKVCRLGVHEVGQRSQQCPKKAISECLAEGATMSLNQQNTTYP